jgi:transketolase
MNMGIAEANMVGVAAGLAKEGYYPWIYTIIHFLVMRPFEQIRVDLCMHRRRAVLIGVGGGLSYDVLGPTHHAIEDLALMLPLPNMEVYSPSTPSEVQRILCHLSENDHPVAYVRLGKNGEPELYDFNSFFDVKRNNGINHWLWMGQTVFDVLFVCTGSILDQVLQSTAELNRQGVSSSVMDVWRIKPLPEMDLLAHIQNAKLVVVVEEHVGAGGLGSLVASAIAKQKMKVRLLHRHLPDTFQWEVASREDRLRELGFDVASLVDDVTFGLNAPN